MEFRSRLTIGHGKGWRVRLSGNPCALVMTLLGLLWLFIFLGNVVFTIRDLYSGYEGTVSRIETKWYDYVSGAFVEWQHVQIATPGGAVIDRYASRQNIVTANIRPGDYVIKARGFSDIKNPRHEKMLDMAR